MDGDWNILLLDDLQELQEEQDWLALCSLIRESPQRRFVLLSRGVPRGCLMAFQYTGLMIVLGADALLFDREDIRKLFQAYDIPVTDSEISGILKESIGHPLGVVITARCMAAGRPFGPDVVGQIFHDVFLYFETAIYQRFDLPVRRFLLDWLHRNTTMLCYDGQQRFHFWVQFRTFLLWELEREYPEEKRRALFSRGGLYYELKEDFPHALECYTRGGDHSKVSKLLIRNAELLPGMGHYQYGSLLV